MNAVEFKARLRGDLKAAMQERRTDETRVLRELIAAIDNAEAVPVENTPYQPRAFGDPSSEAARLALGEDDIAALLGSEVQARLDAAVDYEAHFRPDDAERLRREAALVSSYAGPALQI